MVPLSRVCPWRTGKGARLEECHATLFAEELSRANRSCPAILCTQDYIFFHKELGAEPGHGQGFIFTVCCECWPFCYFSVHARDGGGHTHSPLWEQMAPKPKVSYVTTSESGCLPATPQSERLRTKPLSYDNSNHGWERLGGRTTTLLS